MKLAYVDSSVWITRFEGLPDYQQKIGKHMMELAAKGWNFAASEAVSLLHVKRRRWYD
ncbi:MAG: hypothetical protein GY862_31490 [Gammaproteobacteria bacterium]|nr:hypothetical protein [Gammaproteobacteria bacterium]